VPVCESWHQVPAGSLPNNDKVLARLAMCDAKTWARLRRRVLAAWVQCSDGRFYHPVVAEKALAAWQEKVAYRERKQVWSEAGQRGASNRWNKGNGKVQTNSQPNRSLNGHPNGNPNGNPNGHPNGNPIGQAISDPKGENIATPIAKEKGRGRKTGEASPETPPIELEHSSSSHPAAQAAAGTEQSEPKHRILSCPHDELLELYRKHLPHLPQPRVWNHTRRALLRDRWEGCSRASSLSKGYTTTKAGLAFWDRFFGYVAQSPNLRDGIPRKNGTPWRPDLPWLLKSENFLKVIEGCYEG
jgi:Protein of unknown function (DUF1376)